jgi:hypothetical protein
LARIDPPTAGKRGSTKKTFKKSTRIRTDCRKQDRIVVLRIATAFDGAVGNPAAHMCRYGRVIVSSEGAASEFS